MNPRRNFIVAGALLGLALIALVAFQLSPSAEVSRLVSNNVDAKGGTTAIAQVDALRLTGQTDLGHGLRVPYVLESKGDKLCFEYTYDDQQVVQCTNGKTGFKLEPFESSAPVPLTDEELRGFVDTTVPVGLLVDRWSRGISLGMLERVTEDGKQLDRVQVTLPSGAEATLFVDPATGLETKMLTTRKYLKKEYAVATTYHDWQFTEGVYFPRRMVNQYVGDERTYEMTIDRVVVNPELPDERFEMPSSRNN